MTDVAQILGVVNKGNDNNNSTNTREATTTSHPSRSLLQQASKELPTTLSTTTTTTTTTTTMYPPTTIVPSFIKIGNKQINPHKPARKWTWAPFTSSSRPDGLILHHWVRANVEYPDYPYARFDIHLDPIQYTREEYQAWLQSETWSQSETDALMECARIYELRWPVIHDRWSSMTTTVRHVEELQHRYYSVAAILLQKRISHEATLETKALEAAAAAASATNTSSSTTAAAAATTTTSTSTTTPSTEDPRLLLETAAARCLASADPQHQPMIQQLGTGTSNKVFDLKYEKERRAEWEALWNRTREEEAEEMALRNELHQIEAQLRKLKKRGAHLVTSATAAAGASSSSTTAGAGGIVSRATTPTIIPTPEVAVQQVDHAIASTAPVPVPGVPYLQSARLVLPATGGDTGIPKTLLTRMEALLTEMNVPSTTIATKRACDLLDTVRRDALTWLLLQKQVVQREGILRARRLKLAKMGGNIRVVDEETLMGIAPVKPTKPVTKTPTVSAAATTTTTTGGKSKASGSTKAASGSKAASKKSTTTAATATVGGGTAAGAPTPTTSTETKPRKPSVKRKRKSDGVVPNTTTSSSMETTPVSNTNNKPKKKPKTASSDHPPKSTTTPAVSNSSTTTTLTAAMKAPAAVATVKATTPSSSTTVPQPPTSMSSNKETLESPK